MGSFPCLQSPLRAAQKHPCLWFDHRRWNCGYWQTSALLQWWWTHRPRTGWSWLHPDWCSSHEASDRQILSSNYASLSGLLSCLYQYRAAVRSCGNSQIAKCVCWLLRRTELVSYHDDAGCRSLAHDARSIGACYDASWGLCDCSPCLYPYACAGRCNGRHSVNLSDSGGNAWGQTLSEPVDRVRRSPNYDHAPDVDTHDGSISWTHVADHDLLASGLVLAHDDVAHLCVVNGHLCCLGLYPSSAEVFDVRHRSASQRSRTPWSSPPHLGCGRQASAPSGDYPTASTTTISCALRHCPDQGDRVGRRCHDGASNYLRSFLDHPALSLHIGLELQSGRASSRTAPRHSCVRKAPSGSDDSPYTLRCGWSSLWGP